MTREEASNILDDFDVNFAGHTAEEIAEAFDVAFKALSQEPTVQDKQAESEKYQKAFDDGYANGYAQARFDYEQEPCDDAISRAYIEPIVEELENICVNSDEYILNLLADIKNAPSVTQKSGKWIKSRDCYGNYHFTCSECGNDIATQYADKWEDKYCSECGARMESEE